MPVLTIGIQELHFRFQNIGCFDALTRLECFVDDLSSLQIANPDAIKRLPLAGFDEFVLHNDTGIAIDDDPEPGSKFVSAVTGHCLCCGLPLTLRRVIVGAHYVSAHYTRCKFPTKQQLTPAGASVLP